MKEKGLRLGPLMLLLCLVAIALSTLAVLSFSSARADRILAERYAENVRERYGLDMKGQKWRHDHPEGSEEVLQSEHYELKIRQNELSEEYSMKRLWETSETIDGLWKGE